MSMIGKTLGNFTLEAQIGKGGMGEVYRAKDQKLGRDVAIKVLPEEFAKDADRVARFQREAKLLASLNHPNIAAIYGLEESDGTHFLVLELIEGDTLADQIKKGSIPAEESLKLALQIAEALEAAHERGVIHRDLKPANIKVTPEGKIKVLDFGLAKAFAPEQEEMILSDSPTLSAAATQKGVILGTAAYMSPEQAKGKSLDKKTDVWAFGCVLFEMLTGQIAFSGKDVSEILAAVIRAEPDWSSLPINLHWRLREILERCLEKEAKDRCSGISDARVEIQKVLADPSGVFVQPATAVEHQARLRLILPWAAVTLILGLIIAGAAVWMLRAPEPRRIICFEYHLPEGQGFNSPTLYNHNLAISPDGSQFIYNTNDGLYLRSMNELQARLIPGTEDNPRSPFFSPDGQSVGYCSIADRELKKIPIRGGAPVALCDAFMVYGAIWYEDNTIVYGERFGGIKRISANGGTPETLIEGRGNFAPQLLPDGRSLLFTAQSSQSYKISVQPLDSGKRKELFPGFAAHYLPTGHLVYSGWPGNNTISAVAFDPDTLEVTGEHFPIVEGVGSAFAISESGNLIYIPQATSASGREVFPQRTLVWVDREGNEEPLEIPSNGYNFCRISPDGTKAALAIGSAGNHDIYVLDLERGTMPKLTFDEADDYFPLWTPDGKRIVFYSDRAEGGIYWKAADNTGGVEQLFPFPPDRNVAAWSSDGSTLILIESILPQMKLDIATLSMQGDRQRKPLLQEKYNEIYPQISPDGKWMAYQSDESGQFEIYVRPFPDVDSRGPVMISSGGAHSLLWSPDGKELFYRKGDAILAVPIETEPTINPGKPETLFRGTYRSSDIFTNGLQCTLWDIHPVDRRFLMIKDDATAAEKASKINVIVNLIEDLRQKVPVN